MRKRKWVPEANRSLFLQVLLRSCSAVIMCLGVVLRSGAVAAQVPDLADCYAIGRVAHEKHQVLASTVVILDETVVFDPIIREHTRAQLERLLVPGADLRVLAFSAFIQGRYTRVLWRAKIASPLDPDTRYTAGKKDLQAFDSCQRGALVRARGMLHQLLRAHFEGSRSSIARSDIIRMLREAGENVFPPLRGRRRLIIVSDMLENSDLASFYGSRRPRPIDPTTALDNIRRKEQQLKTPLFAELRGVSVYVIGAGVAPIDATGPNAAASYNSSEILTSLEQFWRGFFERSGARLVEFGKPLLLSQVGGSE